VKFTAVKGNAHFTGVAPADGTGIKFFAEKELSEFNRGTPESFHFSPFTFYPLNL